MAPRVCGSARDGRLDRSLRASRYKRRLLAAHGRATAVTTAFGPEYPDVPYRVLRTELVKRVEGREDEIPPPQPGDPPIGETVLFPFTLRVPYTMPPFSAVVPTPDTTGQFDLMGLSQAKTA